MTKDENPHKLVEEDFVWRCEACGIIWEPGIGLKGCAGVPEKENRNYHSRYPEDMDDGR